MITETQSATPKEIQKQVPEIKIKKVFQIPKYLGRVKWDEDALKYQAYKK